VDGRETINRKAKRKNDCKSFKGFAIVKSRILQTILWGDDAYSESLLIQSF